MASTARVPHRRVRPRRAGGRPRRPRVRRGRNGPVHVRGRRSSTVQYENEVAETVVEAVGLDADAFIAQSIGEEALADPKSAAELIQAHALLAHGKDKGEGKGKDRYPVRPSHLSVQDRRPKLADLKQKSRAQVMRQMRTLTRRSGMSSEEERRGEPRVRHEGITMPVRRQFRIEGEDESREEKAFVASKPVPVPPKPKTPAAQGLTEYADLTCDDESMAAVSEVNSVHFQCLQGYVVSAGVEKLSQRVSDVVEACETSQSDRHVPRSGFRIPASREAGGWISSQRGCSRHRNVFDAG